MGLGRSVHVVYTASDRANGALDGGLDWVFEPCVKFSTKGALISLPFEKTFNLLNAVSPGRRYNSPL